MNELIKHHHTTPSSLSLPPPPPTNSSPMPATPRHHHQHPPPPPPPASPPTIPHPSTLVFTPSLFSSPVATIPHVRARAFRPPKLFRAQSHRARRQPLRCLPHLRPLSSLPCLSSSCAARRSRARSLFLFRPPAHHLLVHVTHFSVCVAGVLLGKRCGGGWWVVERWWWRGEVAPPAFVCPLSLSLSLARSLSLSLSLEPPLCPPTPPARVSTCAQQRSGKGQT